MNFVVLLSGGLDSTVNLYEAHRAGNVKLALTFDYSQRAVNPEIATAKRLCSLLNVPHKVVKLSFFEDLGQSSLVDKSQNVPTGADISMDDLKQSHKTAQSVWVPNRNGIFMNIAAGFAESLAADTVVPGFNLEEAATFPDNSEDFLKALNGSLKYSTQQKVKTHCFTTHLSKTQIVKRGLELGVPFELIWPCYFSEEHWCGKCESCQRSRRAFEANGLELFK
ncbi:MAG: 7-cyano-7-deazaguanine synthase QueC [Bdellovibrionales bacterium]